VLGALAYIVYALWFLQHEKRMAGGTSTAERQTGAEGSKPTSPLGSESAPTKADEPSATPGATSGGDTCARVRTAPPPRIEGPKDQQV
jgi:hypothetical protein